MKQIKQNFFGRWEFDFNTQLFVIWQTQLLSYSNTTSTVAANLTVFSYSTDKINRISNHFCDRWREKWIYGKFTWGTTNIKTKYKIRERYPDIFGKFPLTGVLPNRDPEIRGAVVWIAKTNVIFKPPVNKLISIENTCQEPIKRVWQWNKSSGEKQL